MTIPTSLKVLREATTCAGANALLAAGWELVSIQGRGDVLYIMGWCRDGLPADAEKPPRTSGNLAVDARQ